MLEPEQSAPDFELPNQDGELIRLSDFTDQTVILYFYPKARTRGCTKEACSFRDTWDLVKKHEAQVLGVSTDSIEEIKAFKKEHNLPFPLLSDEDGEVAEAYDSFGTTEVDGETYEIAFRNTYVIDEDNNIKSIYEDVTPEGHAHEILKNL